MTLRQVVAVSHRKRNCKIRGSLGGSCAGGTVAVLLSGLTITIMLLLPTHVNLKRAVGLYPPE